MDTGARPGRALGEVAAVMAKLGTVAFGGPAVHVAMLRDETVRRRRCLGDSEFLALFGAVSVLPGPSSTQLAALGGVIVAALGLMAGVTVDLGRSAAVDPLTALLAAAALIVMLRWRPNGAWLVAGGAAVGAAHALL